MAAKVWYKHIKPGDVVEVKLGKTSIWYPHFGDTKLIVTVAITWPTVNAFAGNFIDPDSGVSRHIHINFSDPESNDYNIIRKIKKES